KKPPATYRYDSSLSPSLEWDGGSARERGEAVIARIDDAQSRAVSLSNDDSDEGRERMRAALEEARDATAALKAMSRPFLNWTGKDERLSFDVQTLPLFVLERHYTNAIIQILTTTKRGVQQAVIDVSSRPRHA